MTTKQRIKRRFVGTWLGPLWLILQPVLFLAAIGFVRVAIFGREWTTPEGEPTSGFQFVLALFVGLIGFWFLSEPINNATSLYRNYSATIRSTPISLEALPCVLLLEALFNLAIRGCMLAIGLLATGDTPSWLLLWVPAIMLPLAVMTLASIGLLAGLGALARDLDLVVPPVTTALLFLSAVFYPIYSLPEHVHELFLLNPLALVIVSLRDVIFWHRPPDVTMLMITTAWSTLLLILSWKLTARLRGKFVDAV